MDLLALKDKRNDRRKSFMLYLIVTVIIIYISVPTYGVIRDLVGPGEVVFTLDSPLPEVRMDRPTVGIIERIRKVVFPSKEVPVTILQRIDLKGRVVYTDQSPYANGMIEFRSDPQYTRTDLQGYFLFIDVEEGLHTISVLDEAGGVLVRANINIERNKEIRDARLVRLPDGTFVFQVAVDIKVLEITLILKKDTDGKIIGLERIELGEQEGVGPVVPGEPMGPPPQEDQTVPEDPENPKKPDTGGSPPTGQDRFNFDVFDTATTVPFGGASSVNVNIFGDKKRIAPGMKGSYQFTVDNRNNNHTSRYDVTFTAADTLPAGHKIPMLYRLKADGLYAAGDDKTWVAIDKLYQDTEMPAAKSVKYTLDWYWPEGENDNEYAQYGGDPRYSYSLSIKVSAQKK